MEPIQEEKKSNHGLSMPAWKRVWAIFIAPQEVFRSIGEKPTWGLILLLSILLTLTVQWVTVQHLDLLATMQQRMEERGQDISEEQLETIQQRAERFQRYQPFITAGFLPLIMVILAGFYFVALKIQASETDFMRTFSMVLHAYWPASLAKSLLYLVLVQRVGKVSAQELDSLVKSNLAVFLSESHPSWLHAIGKTLDLFNIWTFVLLILGFEIVGRLKRNQAIFAVSLIWGIYLLFKVGMAMIF